MSVLNVVTLFLRTTLYILGPVSLVFLMSVKFSLIKVLTCSSVLLTLHPHLLSRQASLHLCALSYSVHHVGCVLNSFWMAFKHVNVQQVVEEAAVPSAGGAAPPTVVSVSSFILLPTAKCFGTLWMEHF